ncbi:MAG: hypothetical protein ACOC96_07250 [Actinomycetota bacterium]
MMASPAPSPGVSGVRRAAAMPFVVLGAASVVGGGLVAAVTSPAGWERGSWVAAYLVLVTGVAQIAAGTGQAVLAPVAPSRRLVAAEFAAWNAGSAAVIAGTLLGVVSVVDLGGVLLAGALALFAWTVRAGGRGTGRWPLLYWLLIVVILVSVPVGLVLARL